MKPLEPRRVLRNWWPCALVLAVVLLGAVLFTQSQPPLYEATAKVYVATESVTSTNDLALGGDFVQQAVKSYADVADTPYVLRPVIDQLHLDATPAGLANQVNVSAAADESVLDITVDAPTSSLAVSVANAVSQRLVEAVSKLSPRGKAGAVKLTQVQPAVAALDPVAPSLPVNLALAAVIGIALGLGASLLRRRLDDRVRDVADVAQTASLPVLGQVGRSAGRDRTHLVGAQGDPIGHGYEALRTNLEFLDLGEGSGPGRVFAVTSASPGEGKTPTATDLSLALASVGHPVLLIDADLRHPGVADLLQIDGANGLSQVLGQGMALDLAVQRLASSTLSVLPAGSVPPRPTELLHGSVMAELLGSARQTYRFVIIDCPPALTVTDAVVLARRADGAIVVVDSSRTRKRELTAVLAELGQVNARVLGFVLTMSPSGRRERSRRHLRDRADAERTDAQPAT